MFVPVITALLVTTLVLFIITRLAAERLMHQHHEQKRDFFAHNPVQPGDIVFLGDSLTDGARWDELFPSLPVKNRGINGDTTTGVLERLGDILSGFPATVFLLIGTNELPWFMYRSDADILATYEDILKCLKKETPDTRVFIQSILPRHPRYARRIQGFNCRLAELANRYGYSYINLFPHFAGQDGGIRPELSNDHLHLMGKGYERWVELLTPHMENIEQHPAA